MHLNPINHPQYGPFNLSLPLLLSPTLHPTRCRTPDSSPLEWSYCAPVNRPRIAFFQELLYTLLSIDLSPSLSPISYPDPTPLSSPFFCLCMSRHSVFLFLCFIVELTDSAYSLSYRYLTYPHPRFINRAYGLKMFSFYEFCLQFVTKKGTVMR